MSLPTLYNHYTSGGISTGLSADNSHFTLNDRNITLYSGAMHYFRVPEEYWRDRLRKMRAAGLNAVETYVPWNLHEPEPGNYDWGQGGSDFQHLLNIEKFLKIAQEEDLFTIVRPGPYICSEWEFGGLPSWLLRDETMKVRTSDAKFMGHVTRYISALFTIITALQFTLGGSIIAVQIENEYGAYYKAGQTADLAYLEQLRDLFREKGIVELLFTSDTPLLGNAGMIPGTLHTANFQVLPELQLQALDKFQPGKAAMVMEYWSGWYDHWTEQHQTVDTKSFISTLEVIFKHPASVNFYMFHGGTSFGFMNGANTLSLIADNSGYQSDTSSYDYDAPLSENGNYTEKYYALKELIEQYNDVKTLIPDMPAEPKSTTHPTIRVIAQLSLDELTRQIPTYVTSEKVIAMEHLPLNNGAGQSYGYVVYRKENMDIPAHSTLRIAGRVCDTVMVLINGKLKSKVIKTSTDMFDFGTWNVKDSTLYLGEDEFKDARLELVVENMGRVNFGTIEFMHQYKGLWQGQVSMNSEVLSDWDIVPLEFKTKWTNSLTGWHAPDGAVGPALYKAVLTLDGPSEDTYIDMHGTDFNWHKGVIIVNGFVLSRYFKLGPQQRAYLPGPFLKQGDNEILIFEHFIASKEVKFADRMLYETIYH